MKKFFGLFQGGLKYNCLMLIPAALLIGLDQLFKYLALSNLKLYGVYVVWDGVFELKCVPNDGAAFSMLIGQRWFFVVITTVVMLFLLGVILMGKYKHQPLLNISFVLVLAGGIGNLIDRIINGYVVDYLYFKLIDFPVFNFADCCLVIGAIFMLIFFFFIYEEKNTKKVPAEKGADNDEQQLDNT